MAVSFRPRAWIVLVTVFGCVAMLSAGFWQLRRADEKRAMIEQYRTLADRPAQVLRVDTPAPSATHPLVVTVSGHYLPDQQLWLDNQVDQGVAGYHVWTPLVLDDGSGIVLVDRGWLAAPRSRDERPAAPVPSSALRLRGYWRELPESALHVENRLCEPNATPVVQYPRFEELRCLFDAPLADGLLWLAPEAEGGFRREWNVVDIGPERHLGYALQWFTFSATLFGLFVVLNLKRKP
ncbi:MAG: SURF1 family protein [Pseudomonadota bacterium]|jgi:surfeit locus 1 family protein|nr:SURF1 family protein [Pseudomonadota bacterium]